LFANIEKYVELIPEDQRYNMFYTVANCDDGKRAFKSQNIIPIDVDGIADGTEEEVAAAVLDELGLSHDDVGVVYSGNGVHILIGTKKPIASKPDLEANKVHYKALMGRLAMALYERGIQAKFDPTVFSASRILRLPFTENRKPNKLVKQCRLINRNIVLLDVDIASLAGVPSTEHGQHIHPSALVRLPPPDTNAVLSGCAFLKHTLESDRPITEPQWYAMLGIVGRLENGDELVQLYSRPKGDKHQKLAAMGEERAAEVVRLKTQHAIESAGPRTCANIHGMFPDCEKCPHFRKITSPIQITGEDRIKTQPNGFYNIEFKEGVPVKGKPNYDDLVKYFNKVNTYVCIEESGEVFIKDTDVWRQPSKSEIHGFAEKAFDPTPSSHMCKEFEQKLRRTNLVKRDFINPAEKLNFKNGVLDIGTRQVSPRDNSCGFTYVIPYDFAPRGSSPVFNKFIEDISCCDAQTAALIKEYLGYCISGTDPALVQKVAILYGAGSNGKSVLLNLVRHLVGNVNVTSFDIGSLTKETNRHAMMNAKINVSSESPRSALIESDVFKAMVAGDYVTVRRLYGEPFEWRCTTRMMFACNELPALADFSYGLSRRLIIIPFLATFSHERGNIDTRIMDKLVAESSDIINVLLDAWQTVEARDFEFTHSEAAKNALESFMFESDSVARFCEELVTFEKGKFVPSNTMYACYVDWCKGINERNVSFGYFCKRIQKHVEKKGGARSRYGSDRGFENVRVAVAL
jgi:putative DNA primase/helicase